MQRFLIALGLAVSMVGCSQEPGDKATTGGSGAAAPTGSKADKPDDRMIYRFHGVYLGCQESQDLARKVLSELPGVSDVVIDPAARVISLKRDRAVWKTAGSPYLDFCIKTGLFGMEEHIDPLTKDGFKTTGLRIPNSDRPKEDTVKITLVFAGSDASRKKIQEILAPSKVTFLGDGPIKSLQVEGKQLNIEVLINLLNAAGFCAAP